MTPLAAPNFTESTRFIRRRASPCTRTSRKAGRSKHSKAAQRWRSQFSSGSPVTGTTPDGD